jgi:hypothetical protein
LRVSNGSRRIEQVEGVEQNVVRLVLVTQPLEHRETASILRGSDLQESLDKLMLMNYGFYQLSGRTS